MGTNSDVCNKIERKRSQTDSLDWQSELQSQTPTMLPNSYIQAPIRVSEDAPDEEEENLYTL